MIGLLAAAVRDPDPVMFFEHKGLYGMRDEVPDGEIVDTEVERTILAQPGVAGAVVFGTQDDRLGERVAALVELQDGATVTTTELRAACEQELAAYKVPEQWAVVASLPRNAMGKVVRTGLADLLPATKGATT